MILTGKPYERHLLAAILIYCLGFATYWNSLSVPFVFDDYPNIRDNPSIRLNELGLDGLRVAAFEGYAERRPVANVSFALNYAAGGYDVKGYHLVNVFIHVINGVLVYFVALILLRRSRSVSARDDFTDHRLRLAALLAAAIFVVHPLQIQAVTYIVQRMSSMAAMFSLTSLLLFLLGRQTGTVTRRCMLWCGAFLAWLLALGAKEIAAALPAVLLLVELLFFRPPQGRRPATVVAYALLAAVGILAAAFVYLGADPATALSDQYQIRSFTAAERVLTELRVLVFYLSLLLFPWPGRLSLDHGFSVSHSLVDPVSTLLCALLLVLMVVLAVRLARRQPIISFCILWYFVTLAIESSFIGLELVFEHRLYLPMFGFALAVAYCFCLVSAHHRIASATLAGLMVVALATATVVRNGVWRDPIALWSDAVSKNPNGYRARNNLGRALADRGDFQRAMHEFDEAIRIEPDFAEPHNNLGALYAKSGRLDAAIEHFKKAIELNPRYVQAYNNLGVALLDAGRIHESASTLSQAVRITPRYAKAHSNLAASLARLGQPHEACRHLLLALELDPSVSYSQRMLESCRN